MPPEFWEADDSAAERPAHGYEGDSDDDESSSDEDVASSPAAGAPNKQRRNGRNAAAADAQAAAYPLVLSASGLYRRCVACGSLAGMAAALEAEAATLRLLSEDGWLVDAWSTPEFTALRPGARSAWRAVPHSGRDEHGELRAAATHHGVRLQRRAADGSLEWHPAPSEAYTP